MAHAVLIEKSPRIENIKTEDGSQSSKILIRFTSRNYCAGKMTMESINLREITRVLSHFFKSVHWFGNTIVLNLQFDPVCWSSRGALVLVEGDWTPGRTRQAVRYSPSPAEPSARTPQSGCRLSRAGRLKKVRYQIAINSGRGI